MTKPIHLLNESELTTTKSDNVVVDTTGSNTGTVICKMPEPAEEVVPGDYISTEDLLAQFESCGEPTAVFQKSRGWIADTFYGEDGDTVRTLRLRKGWSQSRLAEALATSQSHVARIERGTENLTIDTCRRLCKALEIDMNSLDTALQRQESIARLKAKRK